MTEYKRLPHGFNLFPGQGIGFWQSEEQPDLPHPRDYVDLTWDEGERAKVIAYLEDAYYVGGAMGCSWCRMGCPDPWAVPRGPNMGNKTLTDGDWVFPEGYVHYIREHAVKPVPSFLEHIRGNDYKMPVLVPRVRPKRKNCALLDRVTTDLKSAMKARQPLRVAVLRLVLTGAEYARIEKMDNLTDEEVAQIVHSEIERRNEAIDLYRQGSRFDLADKETEEAVILREYTIRRSASLNPSA